MFFIVVGVRFEPRALDTPSLRSALLLVALAATLEVVPMLLLGSRELDRRERLVAGALLSAPLVALVLSVAFPAAFRFLITQRAST